ncbi:MAG: pyridoxamine 5'-phosphate oxidase family protein [Candidatus Atribacteria bacterium]|nr:pyridoxamine 5'-phosphate oxidase family protein [Candidatus Atribacteria bacterium]
MAKKKITLEKARWYLSHADHGHFAMCEEDQPYIIPVHFVLHDHRIFIHSALTGRKLRTIAQNPRICFEVSEVIKPVRGEKPCQFGIRYWSILVFGRAYMVKDPEEKLAALTWLVTKYAGEDRENQLTPENCQNVAVIEITIEEISGKENVDSPAQGME